MYVVVSWLAPGQPKARPHQDLRQPSSSQLPHLSQWAILGQVQVCPGPTGYWATPQKLPNRKGKHIPQDPNLNQQGHCWDQKREFGRDFTLQTPQGRPSEGDASNRGCPCQAQFFNSTPFPFLLAGSPPKMVLAPKIDSIPFSNHFGHWLRLG